MAVKPLSPTSIEITLPDWVIEGVNNAIQENYRGKSFKIGQDEIVNHILKVAPEGTTRDLLFHKHYMDFEEVYRAFGWKVHYESPSWDESFEAYFEFEPKR